MLSTPSLGITALPEEVDKTLQALEAFNSLSRDHRMVLALVLETGLPFNSLSRDHRDH